MQLLFWGEYSVKITHTPASLIAFKKYRQEYIFCH
jgi:hypothetical protein